MAGKKGLWSWVPAAILILFVVAAQAGTAIAQDTIKIGAVLPLSKAAFAQAGEEQRRGLLMALEEINQAGGVLGKKVGPDHRRRYRRAFRGHCRRGEAHRPG